MYKLFSILSVFIIMSVMPVPALASSNQSTTIPTFSIQAVVKNKSVTIKTYNFPANDSFNALMNFMGTKGKNGFLVGTVDSGDGGTFTATFTIPSELKGQSQIAIRLQSNTGSGWFAYNWFFNSTTGTSGGSGTGGGGSGTSGYSGFPVFFIESVVRNSSVTIQTSNLPPHDTFKVLMGPMGTKGVNGTFVTSVGSGSGGTKTYTFSIPSNLKGRKQISIRMQSTTGSGYFAYNWFFNNTAN